MFHTTFTDETAAIAAKIQNGTTLRVLLVLPQHLSYEHFKRLDQRRLGEQLGMGQNSVSRALKELHELEFIERKGTGPVTEWRLNNDFGWRGTVDSYHAFNRAKGRNKTGKLTPQPGQPSQKEYYANSSPAESADTARSPR